MPFKSEKQRKWMWANDPEMAKKWEKEEKMKQETKVRQLIRKMVREVMKEGFAGALKEKDRKAFNKMRQKQSEVLGYKLAGTPDIKVEIDDATKHSDGIHEGKLNEFNKKHFLNLIKQEIDSIKGQKAYVQDALRQKDIEKWEKKEFEAVWKELNKRGKELQIRLRNTKLMKEDRDYKDEYKKFQSSDKSKKYRAELNKYNRKKGTYGNGDGKDASHKGGKIAGFEKESVNRGRAEKSRLKKEGTYRVSPRTDVQWRGSDIVIVAGKNKVRLSKKEFLSMLKGLKRNRVTEKNGKVVSKPVSKPVVSKPIVVKPIKPPSKKVSKKTSTTKVKTGTTSSSIGVDKYHTKIKKKKKKKKKNNEGKLTEGKFYAWIPGKSGKITVNAKDLSDAKKQVVSKYKVPMTKWGLIAILSQKAYDQQQYRFEGKLNEAKETIFDVAKRVVKNKQHEKWKGQILDMQSANLLTKVHKKVNSKMKKILTDLGNKDPRQLMATLWAVVK